MPYAMRDGAQGSPGPFPVSVRGKALLGPGPCAVVTTPKHGHSDTFAHTHIHLPLPEAECRGQSLDKLAGRGAAPPKPGHCQSRQPRLEA